MHGILPSGDGEMLFWQEITACADAFSIPGGSIRLKDPEAGASSVLPEDWENHSDLGSFGSPREPHSVSLNFLFSQI